MFTEQDFATDIGASTARILFAFAASAVLAVPIGIWMSSFKVLEGLLGPVVDFVRYVPVPALVPLFVLWTGIGEEPKFLVLFFGTFFQLVLLVKDDADQVPSRLFELARTMGARTPQLFRDVLLPAMMPQLYDRLRVTLGWCWTYLVIAELVAVENGVGHVIKEAQRFNAADQLFVCLITLGFIGLLTDYIAKLGYGVFFRHTERGGAAQAA
jgi:NitT/TauT family transport system permease protein